MNNVATVMGVLEAIGTLIVSPVMLKGTFSRGIVYLRIVTGARGVVCEGIKPVIGIDYIVYGLLLFVWLPAIGWMLIRLPRQPEPVSIRRKIAA